MKLIVKKVETETELLQPARIGTLTKGRSDAKHRKNINPLERLTVGVGIGRVRFCIRNLMFLPPRQNPGEVTSCNGIISSLQHHLIEILIPLDSGLTHLMNGDH